MDILIPNLELPLEERIQLSIYPNGLVVNHSTLDVNNRRKAIELPSHGRLGDLDALKNSVADMRMEKPLRNGAKQVIEIGELFGRIIDDAPTIVEATE